TAPSTGNRLGGAIWHEDCRNRRSIAVACRCWRSVRCACLARPIRAKSYNGHAAASFIAASGWPITTIGHVGERSTALPNVSDALADADGPGVVGCVPGVELSTESL